MLRCVPYIEGWRRLADDAGITMQIETHRDRMTTDLFFTLQLLDRFPDLRLTGDLSDDLVGREFWYPVDEENHRLMRRIMDNCWSFHGRVASREQIQAQTSFAHHKPLAGDDHAEGHGSRPVEPGGRHCGRTDSRARGNDNVSRPLPGASRRCAQTRSRRAPTQRH